MNKLLIALASAGVLFVGAGPGAMASDSHPALTAAASAALTQAESDVNTAKKKEALWTTATKALKAAKAAAAKGDSTAVVKQAKTASDLAALGIKQLSYPTTHFY